MIKQMPLAEEPNPGLHYREAVSKYCNAANQPHERKTLVGNRLNPQLHLPPSALKRNF
jgi:hypothetical protein